MLRLMEIQHMREREPEHVYLVTLERDGKAKQYEFTWEPPSKPDSPDHVHEPMDIVRDLLDYRVLPADGRFSDGALLIPALRAIINAVSRVAHGKSLNLPLVLDQR